MSLITIIACSVSDGVAPELPEFPVLGPECNIVTEDLPSNVMTPGNSPGDKFYGYIAFGNAVHLTGTKYALYVRNGDDHTLGGKVMKWEYDICDQTHTLVHDVATGSSGKNIQDVHSFVYNGSVYLFFATTPFYASTFDMYLYKSTDGLIGEAFTDTGVSFSNAGVNGAGNAYGRPLVIGSTIYLTWYQYIIDGTTTNELYVEKSTDGGQTFSRLTPYSETDNFTDHKLTEHCLVIKGDKWLILTRTLPPDVGADFRIRQITSSDGGQTFSSPSITNLGDELGDGIKMPEAYLDSQNRLQVMYGDRSSDVAGVMRSWNNDFDAVFADPTTYNTPVLLQQQVGSNVLGYPTMIEVQADRFLQFNFADRIAADTHQHFGDGYIN